MLLLLSLLLVIAKVPQLLVQLLKPFADSSQVMSNNYQEEAEPGEAKVYCCILSKFQCFWWICPIFWGKWQKCGFKTTQCSVPYFKVTTQRLDRILLPRLPLWNLLISSSCFVPSLWVQLKNLVSFSTLLSTLLCKNEWFSDIIPHTVAEKSSQKSYLSRVHK